jgi:hypothetical protein
MANIILKQQGVINLVDLKVKKVTPAMIRTEAKSLGLSFQVLNKAWNNFVEFEVVDLRTKDGKSAKINSTVQQLYNKNYFKGLKRQNLTVQQSCNVLREYIFTGIKAVDLLKKYSLDKDQFYGLVHELNVSGSILGKRVLDPKKYAKTNVKEVIRFVKKPHLFKTTGLLHRAHLQRVVTVLDKYL